MSLNAGGAVRGVAAFAMKGPLVKKMEQPALRTGALRPALPALNRDRPQTNASLRSAPW